MYIWEELYNEVAQRILEKLPEIRWVDLWHNQTSFLEEEVPFPTPCIFLGFRTLAIEDRGENVQMLTMQVDFYLFYETFLETYTGAYNKDGALEFTRSLDKIHANFHGTSGTTYSNMKRIAINPEDTGGSGNLYRTSFSCSVEDTGAMKQYDVVDAPNLQVFDDLEVNGFVITRD
jgi:hypothetical protein